MIGSLGWQELLIILVILALLFGANRVAGLGGALGKGIREFRSEARVPDQETPQPPTETTAPPAPAPAPGDSVPAVEAPVADTSDTPAEAERTANGTTEDPPKPPSSPSA